MSSARTLRQEMLRTWARVGPRFLPFADAATAELPLSRLLRLSLFQVSVGMALVLMIGTLTRVMIVELHVPATLVGLMISLPLLAAPFRAVIGFRSDHHRSELGWRRVPCIWMGTLIQFGGLAIMPFALLVLSGLGHASQAPAWVGQGAAAIAFLLVGAGIAVALGGILRDLAAMVGGSAFGYTSVYALEIVLLSLMLVARRPLLRPDARENDFGNNRAA